MKKSSIHLTLCFVLMMGSVFCFALSSAEALDKSDACHYCHEEVLVEIGNGAHMESPLEAGQVYSKCENCHSACPEVEGPLVSVHDFSRFENQELCVKCHFSGNQARAGAMVLPYKSVLCMPCHVSKWTVNDNVTIISLSLFFLFLLIMTAVWFSGNVKGAKSSIFSKLYFAGRMVIRTLFSTRIFRIIQVLVLDALLQRRLFRQSKTRWAIHGLIFFPMLVRFSWALLALFISGTVLDQSIVPALSDTNHTLFGLLFFEITGLLPILGMILLLLEKALAKHGKLESLPSRGRLAYYLFGSVFVLGFILKGLQIAMTGFPDGSAAAFASFCIATLMQGANHIAEIYGYVWYAHAGLYGVFIACLPFGRMWHVVMAPVAVVIREMHQSGKQHVNLQRKKINAN